MLAHERKVSNPLDPHTLPRLLSRADGSLSHAYIWLGDRADHLPLIDVAGPVGEESTVTLLTCYWASTNDQPLSLMSEERKVRDAAVVRGDALSGGRGTGKTTM